MRKLKKAFTIVELVVVIAVIGILAAVLIPTFSNIASKAKINSDIQTARNLSMNINIYKTSNNINKITKEIELKNAIIASYGIDFWNNLSPSTNDLGYHYFFDIESQSIVMSKIDEEPLNDHNINVKSLSLNNEINDLFNNTYKNSFLILNAEESNNKDLNFFEGENTIISNILRCSIKDGYYLMDQVGDDLTQACVLLDSLNESDTPIDDFNKAWDILNLLNDNVYKNKEFLINVMKKVIFLSENYTFVHPEYINQSELIFSFCNNIKSFRSSYIVIYQENDLRKVLNVSNIVDNIKILLPSTINSIDTNALQFIENYENQVELVYQGSNELLKLIKAGTSNVVITNKTESEKYKVVLDKITDLIHNKEIETKLECSDTSILIKFFNYDESLLFYNYILKGEEPKYLGLDPEKPENKEFKFTFNKWMTVNDEELSVIPCDCTEKEKEFFAVYNEIPKQKFESILTYSDNYVYRVGNMNKVYLKYLFKQKDNITVDSSKVEVEIDSNNKYDISLNYENNNDDWKESSILFVGSGFIELIIKEDGMCPEKISLEVVEAKNYPCGEESLTSTTNNVCLLKNVYLYLNSINVENGYSLFGNGFKIICAGDGNRLGTNGMGEGFVNVRSGSTLDNVQVIAPIYPNAFLYAGKEVRVESNLSDSSDDTHKRYMYQWSAVAVTGDSTISNSYIYGGRNNIYVGGGNIVLENNVLECGVLSNIEIESDKTYTVTLKNNTTIQHRVIDSFGKNQTMLGTGIIGGTEDYTNPTIIIQGELKMYNWASEDDSNYIGNDYAKTALSVAVNKTEFQHTLNDTIYINSGLIFINTNEVKIIDERDCKDDFMISTLNSYKVYSQKANTGLVEFISDDYEYEPKKNNDYMAIFKFLEPSIVNQEVTILKKVSYSCNKATYNIQFDLGYTFALKINDIFSTFRYSNESITDISYSLSSLQEDNIDIHNDEILYKNSGTYYLNISVIVNDITTYGLIIFNVEVVDRTIKDAIFEFNANSQKWIESGSNNIYQSIAFLGGLKIYDYLGDETTKYLRFDGDDTTYKNIAYLDLSDLNKNTDKSNQNPSIGGDHIIRVVLVDGGIIEINLFAKANTGSSTYSLTINTLNGVIYAKNGGTTGGRATTWNIFNYKFIGNSGAEICSSAQTFTKGDSFGNPNKSFNRLKKYTITYDANGGLSYQTVSYATDTYQTIILPNCKNGNKNFVGWYTAKTGGTLIGLNNTEYTPTSDITLYAHWSEPTIITFNPNGGYCDILTLEKCGNSKIQLPIPSTYEYEWFCCWSDGINEYMVDEEYIVPMKNVTLTAIWKDKYDINFDVVDLQSTAIEQITYSGISLTLPLPISSNKSISFVGWYRDLEYNSFIGLNGINYIPEKDETLYAKWVTCYTVTYDANGGSVNPTSFTYDGVREWILPTPTYNGYWFDGWYLGDTKINNEFTVEKDVTFIAKWNPEYTIVFNTNGGNEISTFTYRGDALVLPTTNKTGYTLEGWYSDIEYSNFIGNSETNFIPEKNETLFAKWKINTYTITLSLSEASGSVSYNGVSISSNKAKIDSVPYGSTITIIFDSFKKGNKSIKYNDKTLGTETGTFNFDMPDSDVTVEIKSWDNTCFTGDTIIEMENGTKKRADEIKVGDIVSTFDHFTGTISNSYISYVFNSFIQSYVIKLNFEYDLSFTIINAHCLYNKELNKYVEISSNNANDFLGKHFYSIDYNGYVELTSYEITYEYIETYSFLTEYDINHFANGFLVISDDINGFFNYFECDEFMKYDEVKMQEDINDFGLVTYDMFKDYCKEEEFEIYNLKFLGISIGKGLTTYEKLIEMMMRYSGNSK